MNTPKQSIKALLSRGSKLFIATLLIATVAPQVLNIKPASADSGSYPWYDAPCASSGSNLGKTTGTGYWCSGYNWGESTCLTGDTYCTSGNKMNGYYVYDQWGESFRNCVSYTAWKLSTVFNINTSNWGNGADWNNSALAAGKGYTDDSSPQVGDIAQWNSPAPWGHVAYVYAVNNGIASYDEFNYGQDGNFLSSYTSASNSQGTPDHWIHIGTISTPPPPEVNYLLTRLGSIAQVKVGLNTGWQTMYSNASDIQAAGTRMAFKDASTGHIWAKDTPSGTLYDEGTADQYVLTSSYIIERLGNVLQAKAGLNDNWTSLYSWVTDVKAAGQRIAIIDTGSNLMAKDTLTGAWYTESSPTIDQYVVTTTF